MESDVSTKAGCDSLADQIKAKEDSLDILVNNSGLSWGAPMDKTDETKGWDKGDYDLSLLFCSFSPDAYPYSVSSRSLQCERQSSLLLDCSFNPALGERKDLH